MLGNELDWVLAPEKRPVAGEELPEDRVVGFGRAHRGPGPLQGGQVEPQHSQQPLGRTCALPSQLFTRQVALHTAISQW